MMTLSFFLTAGIGILVWLFVTVAFAKRNHINRRGKNIRWVYFSFLAVLAVLAVFTIDNYVYPKKNAVFKNTDYHIIEHKGFKTDSVFHLVRQLPDDFHPEKSLWDGKSGLVKLSPDSIIIADYCEPFYIERKSPSYRKKDSLSNHRKNAFILANKIVPADISSKGLTLTKGTDTLYRLRIVEDHDAVWYISSSSSSLPDTSQFTKRINRGYPLTDIVVQSPHFDFNEKLQELLEGVILVRESIPITNNFGGESTGKNTSPLLLFPGTNLYYAGETVLINGSTISERRFSVPHRGNTLFYSGIGRTKTDVCSLSYIEKEKSLEIRYVLPKMQKLKNGGGQLFLSSSVETILEDSKDGGYYYNIFNSEDNCHHINAEIRYLDGTAREGIKFEVMDVYSACPSEKTQYDATDGKNVNEFLLSVKDRETDKTKWIFDIKDLRASNPLQPRHIILFVLVFVFLVGLRLMTDTFFTRQTLTVLELSAYVVVLCLCVVRLILGWRASTFVPIEDISAPMFAKMRSSIWKTTCLAWALPAALIVLSIVGDTLREGVWNLGDSFRKHPVPSLPEENRSRWQSIWAGAANKDVILYFVLTLVACALLCRGPLVRLMNIPVPLISFLIFDYWLVSRELEQKTSFTTARVFLALLTFGYLFFKDAGFTIIFFVFLFIYHVIIGTLLDGAVIRVVLGKRVWNRVSSHNWLVYLVCIALIAVLFLFLMYEGDLMIWAFNHVGLLLLGLGLTSASLFFISLSGKKEEENDRGLVRIIYAAAAIILLSAGTYEILPGSSHFISEKINTKVHMKYRAEVQKLREGEMIDDLIEKCDFKSTDITYIMRSAHNQWFINQYLRAGESLKSKSTKGKGQFFILQPHSNQGSSYTTQTTDLVITRYVLAEHGSILVVLFMILFLFLILGYIFEVRLQDGRKREMMAPLLLLFSISLMVFLSATNRVVFVGQDFPFISLQSRVAVLFPLALLYLAIRPIIIDKKDGRNIPEKNNVRSRKWAIVAGMLAFAASCVIFIPQQGKHQNEDQFDVSQVIQSLAEKVDVLDKSLIQYQNAHERDRVPANTLQKDTLWRRYVKDSDYSAPLHSIMEDSTATNRFYRSLIDYFDTRQAVKNDPEELLHMRKRSGYWHLDLNKKHFFIRSMLDDGLQWNGDLLAAKTKRLFAFKGTRNGTERRLTSTNSYEKNILPPDIQDEVVNVRISRFDESWTNLEEPLLLISSLTAQGSQQYFSIEAPDETIKGSPREPQISTRIKEGDLVMINRADKRGDKEVLGWRYGRDNENYLAKNIWMNGSQRLFYPLGKESMWSYQFANAVSNALGKSDEYRDSTLRVSIDYDLHHAFYDILTRKNRTRLLLKEPTVNKLQAFEVLSFKDMKDINNSSVFYYDANVNQIKVKNGKDNADIRLALNHINRRIGRIENDTDKETQISNAIEAVIERKFDFSAVVLDGNGRIRLLFDHTRSRNIDPNDIRYFNKFVSDMYKNGDNRTERDIFGNKALQILPSGPGSSFKPIAYTAITSAEKLAWEQLDLTDAFESQARSAPKSDAPPSNSKMYDYYGGLDLAKHGEPQLSIDNYGGYSHNNYLIKSDNLYHSAIILLGQQPKGHVEDILKNAGNDKYAFPVISYKGALKSFDPEKWYPLDVENGIMNDGLYRNFHLQGNLVSIDKRYSNFYGESSLFRYVFEHASGFKAWSYPETGSQNIPDRKLRPQIRNGFNQMFLGSYPLEVTPLQMAVMGMRLATLNKEPSVTTLDDRQNTPPDYSFFDVPDWREAEFHQFFQRQVLAQLKEVPVKGTASALAGFSSQLSREGYYMYVKTGTLNDERAHASKQSRMKHLFVIISNSPLESVSSIESLRQVKYYVLYLSYIGVDISEGFNNNDRFQEMISAVVNSDLFHEYMEN